MIGNKQSKLEEHFEELLKTPVPNMLLYTSLKDFICTETRVAIVSKLVSLL
jgi:hypothetical protein